MAEIYETEREVKSMATTNFIVRLDSHVKKQAEALYGELGIDLSTAINVFLHKSHAVGGFPFDFEWKNEKEYDAEEALRELKK